MKKIFNTQNELPANKKNVTYILGMFSVLYVILLYLLGIYFGFYKATVTFSVKTFTTIILPLILFIILTEYVREKILGGKFKYKKILAFAIVVIAEALINIKKYDFTNSKDFLAFWGYVFFVAIINNLLFNYISIRYGKYPNIVYRLICSLYVYIIPVTPDIHLLIHTFIKMILPYIIYCVLEYTYPERKTILKYQKKKYSIVNFILIILMISITMLVSCNFKYGVLVIGSESMTGTINKGDIVFFEKYNNQKVKKGDIILFKSDKRIIVHRVVETKNINDEKRYYTKGDANKVNDEGYVTNNELVGIYKSHIKKIGNLTLWFNKTFEK